MPTFEYKAIARSGKEVSGQLFATTKDELGAKLREEGLYIISWKETEGPSAQPAEGRAAATKPAWLKKISAAWENLNQAGTDPARIRGGLNARTLATTTWQMSIALKSGITLTEILGTIARETPDRKVRAIFNFFYDRITSVHTLSDSLAFFPDVFSVIYINMVRAGEAGGFLPKALDEATAYLKRQDRLNKKVKSMLIYPVMLTVIATATVVFMATFIMPIFVQVFTDMNAELPTLTKVLLFIFGGLRKFAFIWLGLFVVLFFYARTLYKRLGSSLTIDTLVLKIPILGSMMLKIAVSRFLGTLAVLLKTNVSILDSLLIGKAVAGNTALAVVIDDIHNAVQSGKPMAEKMAGSKYFPGMVTMMVSSGERSGNLPEALEKVTEYYIEEVDISISDTLSIIEPLIVVVMGLFIALVAAGLLLPIFNLPGYIE